MSLSLRHQLGNKSDLPQALSIENLIKEMKLDKITNRPVSVRFSLLLPSNAVPQS